MDCRARLLPGGTAVCHVATTHRFDQRDELGKRLACACLRHEHRPVRVRLPRRPKDRTLAQAVMSPQEGGLRPAVGSILTLCTLSIAGDRVTRHGEAN